MRGEIPAWLRPLRVAAGTSGTWVGRDTAREMLREIEVLRSRAEQAPGMCQHEARARDCRYRFPEGRDDMGPATAGYADGWRDAIHYVLHGALPDELPPVG